MNASDEPATTPADFTAPGARWYCLRTRNRQEARAALALRQQPDIEVYGPRLRYRKPTRRGTVWFVEALFPNYLFARFDPALHEKTVRYAAGVAGPVAFGGRLAVVPDAVVERLRAELGDGETCVCMEPFSAGDIAEFIHGPFRGLEAVILRVLPARERVRVLLNFLGRETEVEIANNQLAKPAGHPLAEKARRAGTADPEPKRLPRRD